GVRLAQLGGGGAGFVTATEFVERVSLPVKRSLGARTGIGDHAVEIGKRLIPLAAVERALPAVVQAVIATTGTGGRELISEVLGLGTDLIGLRPNLIGLHVNLRELVLKERPEIEVEIEGQVQVDRKGRIGWLGRYRGWGRGRRGPGRRCLRGRGD